MDEDRISAIIDDPDFQEIDRATGKFNIFDAVGGVRGELRHSNFLAFLLSPSRSHGFGSLPLLRVLRGILGKIETNERPIGTLALVLGDLDSAVVLREWNNIDLLVEIKSLNFVLLVENKIDAAAGRGQLARYKLVVEEKYPYWRRLLVFLTPNGASPDENGYVAFSYYELAKILEGIIHSEESGGADGAKMILSHYVEMLRRHIVEDEELKSRARELYERHKEAFDFIYKSRPQSENFVEILRELIEQREELVSDHHGGRILRFAPPSWGAIVNLNCCNNEIWTKTGRSVLFEIRTWGEGANENRIIVSVVIGPAPSAVREKIYTGALYQPSVFRGLSKPMGKVYSTIFSRPLLLPKLAQGLEFAEKVAAVEANWDEFLSDELPQLTEAVLKIAQDADA